MVVRATSEGAAPLGGRWWWAALATVWTAFTLSAWPHLHDDAFVHVHAAADLVQGRSVGTDSPMWTAMIAAAGAWCPRDAWPMLAKSIAVAGSALALIVVGVLARPSASSRTHGMIAAALVLTFAAPATLASLQDGSELGVLVAAAVFCGWAIDRWLGVGSLSSRVLLLGVAAALPAVIRIDAAPIGVATLVAARALDRRGWAPAVATTCAIVLPVFVWIRWSTGALVPAAILGDHGVVSAWCWPADVIAASSTTNPWWIVGAVGLALVVLRRHPMRPLAGLGLAPTFVAVWVGAMRGQDPTHAATTVLPALAFAWSIVWVAERHTGGLARRLERRAGRRVWNAAVLLGVVHLVATWPEARSHVAPTRADVDARQAQR